MSKILSIAALALAMFVTAGSASAQTLKEQDTKARAQYKATQQFYQSSVNVYKKAQSDFQTAREKYQKSKTTQDKTALEEKSKTFLTNAAEAMIKHLEALKNRVQNMAGISESDRTSIIAEIDKDISWLKDKQPQIATATPAQIKEHAKTIREYWQTVRVTVKKVTGRVLAARINTMIAKADSFTVKVSEKITELKNAGKDTTKLEAWLADYNSKIALAKEKQAAATAKFSAISNVSEANALFKEGHQFVKDANKYIKEAYANLKQIVKEMRSMGGTVTPPATSIETTE